MVAIYRQLLWLAEKSRSPNPLKRAKASYRGITGGWPRRAWEDMESLPPSSGVQQAADISATWTGGGDNVAKQPDLFAPPPAPPADAKWQPAPEAKTDPQCPHELDSNIDRFGWGRCTACGIGTRDNAGRRTRAALVRDTKTASSVLRQSWPFAL